MTNQTFAGVMFVVIGTWAEYLMGSKVLGYYYWALSLLFSPWISFVDVTALVSKEDGNKIKKDLDGFIIHPAN